MKSLPEFYKDKTKYNGVGSLCKPCDIERGAIKQRRVWQYIVKRKVASSGCAVCGYSLFHQCLDYHHIKGKDKALSKCKSIREARIEIAKCMVLCCTCHRLVTCGLMSVLGVATGETSKQRPPLLEWIKEGSPPPGGVLPPPA